MKNENEEIERNGIVHLSGSQFRKIMEKSTVLTSDTMSDGERRMTLYLVMKSGKLCEMGEFERGDESRRYIMNISLQNAFIRYGLPIEKTERMSEPAKTMFFNFFKEKYLKEVE